MTLRTITAQIQNDGNAQHTFPVNLLIVDGVSGSGCNIAWANLYSELSSQNITLMPGQTGNITWQFDDASLGFTTTKTVQAIGGVWEDTGRFNCLDKNFNQFIVEAIQQLPTSASVTSVYAIPNRPIYSFQSVSIYVTVKNTSLGVGKIYAMIVVNGTYFRTINIFNNTSELGYNQTQQLVNTISNSMLRSSNVSVNTPVNITITLYSDQSLTTKIGGPMTFGDIFRIKAG